MNKNIQRGLVAVGVLVSTSSAMAAGPDMSTLTAAVDFSTVQSAIMSIAGLLAVVYVAIKGTRIVLGIIRG